MDIAIVAIAYNRVESLKRLLKSLEKANYFEDQVTLYISVDKSSNDKVEQFALKYVWPFGEKITIFHEKNLGLRKHILKCGDLVKNHDALIVFEDDIFVSEVFYKYSKATVKKYWSNKNIAGISLYSPKWQTDSNRPFSPVQNGYDVYFMQYAQSWGQIWFKDQWFEFKKWYQKNIEWNHKNSDNIPNNILDWPKSSWLKYHTKYCIEENKYFVYPYESLSTNFSEFGQHNKNQMNTKYQISILDSFNRKFQLCNFNDDKAIKYDSFFENENIGEYISINSNKLTVDLYGTKKKYQRFLLTTKNLEYKVISKYALALRPHEMNVKNNLPGEVIKLYDTSQRGQEKLERVDFPILEYDIKYRSIKKYLQFCLEFLKSKFF